MGVGRRERGGDLSASPASRASRPLREEGEAAAGVFIGTSGLLTVPADGATSFSSRLGPSESRGHPSHLPSPNWGPGGNAVPQNEQALWSQRNPAVIWGSCARLT